MTAFRIGPPSTRVICQFCQLPPIQPGPTMFLRRHERWLHSCLLPARIAKALLTVIVSFGTVV